jgi:DNA-binding MarR family transcriptional regulator
MATPPDLDQITRVCACFNLRKADRVVTQIFDAVMAEAGITATQFTLLAAIGRHPGLPISRLAYALAMDRTTLTRNLQLLVRQDLVTVAPARDQRRREVRLTTAGAALAERLRPRWQQAQAQVIAAIGAERWRPLLAELQALVAALQAPDPAP